MSDWAGPNLAAMAPTITILAVYALAVARLTRLVTTDRITAAPRATLLRRIPEQHLAAYLITCDWCASIWIAAAAAPAIWWFSGRPWLLVPALGLALSYVTGRLAATEP